MRSRRGIGGLVLVVALLCATAGCGGGGSSSSTSTTTSTTAPVTTAAPSAGGNAKAEISAAWKTFFNGATPVAKRVALLAGGQRFSATIKALSTNPLASKTSATVSKVTVTGPTTATVVFTVYLAGAPVLANVKGNAVLQNGTWLVEAGSLCKLLALQGSPTAACSAAG